jgi:hypothetical protein
MSLGRVVWRRGSKPVDWALIVAFIRLEFPSDQRELAQKIAGGLAEIVGLKIKQLRPEHTIKQIAEWANEPVSAVDLIKIFRAAFNIACDESTTFRALVEMIAAQQLKSAERESRT